MKLGVTKYHNFACFIDEEFDFSRPGLTTIEGEINIPGSDGNGAGKSFMFDGVAWCWYGRCLREKYKTDDVCRLGMPKKEHTSVETNIVGGEHPIRIVRYRKHPRLGNRVQVFVGGKDCTGGTDAETQHIIERLLGMDFTAFSNAVAFGAREDVKSFFAATDTARKEVLDRLIGLEVYTEAEKVARRRLRGLGEKLDSAASERSRLQERLATLNEQRGSVTSPEDLAEEELMVRRQKAQVKVLLKRKQQLDLLVASAEADLEAAEAEFKATQEAHQKTLDANAQKRSAFRAAIREAERSVGKMEGSLRSARSRLARYEEMGGKECSECGQEVPAKHVKKVATPLLAEIAETEHDLETQRNALHEFQVDLDLVKDPPPPVSMDIDTFEQEVDLETEKAEEAHNRHEVARERLRHMQAAYEEHLHAAEKLQGEIDTVSADLAAAEDEYVALQRKAEALEFWVQGFGNTGLKSLLIEAEIPEINRRATGYCQKLLPPGSRVQLAATRKLKSRDARKEELSIKAVIPGLTESYAGASKGQKRRLDLSLLLAFGDLVAARTVSPFEQMFADEIFDGLDRTGAAAVVSMLREAAEDCPVALVTHDPSIKSSGDHMARVVHDGTAARIISGDSGKKDDRRKPRSRSGRRTRQGK